MPSAPATGSAPRPDEVGPEAAAGQPDAWVELVSMMRRLRRECGWKAAQTHRSLARHLLEEAHELAEVLDDLEPGTAPHDDPSVREHLCEELGDVLLQVVLHAAIAEEQGWFDIDDVVRGLSAKLLRRNSHVFGASAAEGLGETDPHRINELWERAKAGERQRTDPLEGVPVALPALARAAKVLERRERAGAAPLRRGTPADGVGQQLLALVDRARHEGLDPEQELRDALGRIDL